MKSWPPKPGLTDMVSTRSRSSSTYSSTPGRGRGVERDPRLGAGLPDLGQDALQMHAGLGVDGDEIGPRPGIGLDPALGLLDHQVEVEREPGALLDGLDDGRSDRQVRDEVAVHDVDVDLVGAGGLHQRHGVAECGEVGGQDARGDLHGEVRRYCKRQPLTNIRALTVSQSLPIPSKAISSARLAPRYHGQSFMRSPRRWLTRVSTMS